MGTKSSPHVNLFVVFYGSSGGKWLVPFIVHSPHPSFLVETKDVWAFVGPNNLSPLFWSPIEIFLAPFHAKFLILFTDKELPGFPVRFELRTLRDSTSNKAIWDVKETQLLSDTFRGDLPILLDLTDDHLVVSGSRFPWSSGAGLPLKILSLREGFDYMLYSTHRTLEMIGNLASSRPSPVHSTYFSSFTRRQVLDHGDFSKISRASISSDSRTNVWANFISDYMI